MVTREEAKEYAEIRALATTAADKRGERPRLDAPFAAIFIGMGVFFLLELFASITLSDLTAAFWPLVVLTTLCAGAAYATQYLRGKAWSKRFDEEERRLLEERERRRAMLAK